MNRTQRLALSICGPAAIFFLAASAQAGTYLDSAHGGYNTSGKGVKRLTNYATGNCAHCHEQHASIGGSEPAPASGTPSPYGLFDVLDNNALCNYCHDTSVKNGADDIASQIAKTSSHDPASAISPVLCVDCHNPHVAQITTHSPAVDGNQVGNPTAPKSGPLLNVPGVSVSWTAPGTPGAGSETLNNATLAAKNPITAEYELCFKCHGGQVTGLTNLTGQFNPDNYAHHPVALDATGQWRNTTIRANYTTLLKAPWNANLDAAMYCSDCHGSETTGDPSGPHGSNNAYMLKATGPGSSYDNLCLMCHADAYNGGGAGFPSAFSHDGGGAGLAHKYQGENAGDNKLGCMACHGGPDLADYAKVSGVTSNGGSRNDLIHGENFMWQNPDGSSNPASSFLLGGYLLGINTATRSCWAGMSGTDGCHLVTNPQTW